MAICHIFSQSQQLDMDMDETASKPNVDFEGFRTAVDKLAEFIDCFGEDMDFLEGQEMPRSTEFKELAKGGNVINRNRPFKRPKEYMRNLQKKMNKWKQHVYVLHKFHVNYQDRLRDNTSRRVTRIPVQMPAVLADAIVNYGVLKDAQVYYRSAMCENLAKVCRSFRSCVEATGTLWVTLPKFPEAKRINALKAGLSLEQVNGLVREYPWRKLMDWPGHRLSHLDFRMAEFDKISEDLITAALSICNHLVGVSESISSTTFPTTSDGGIPVAACERALRTWA